MWTTGKEVAEAEEDLGGDTREYEASVSLNLLKLPIWRRYGENSELEISPIR